MGEVTTRSLLKVSFRHSLGEMMDTMENLSQDDWHNTRRDLPELDVRGENWFDLAQDRMTNGCYRGDKLASSITHRLS